MVQGDKMMDEYIFKVKIKSYQYIDKYEILDALEDRYDIYGDDEVIIRVEEIENDSLKRKYGIDTID